MSEKPPLLAPGVELEPVLVDPEALPRKRSWPICARRRLKPTGRRASDRRLPRRETR
jgi:hypothetical protein